MTMDSLRSAVLFLFDPFVNVFHAYKISANTLSVLALMFAMLAGVGYYFSSGSSLVLFIALMHGVPERFYGRRRRHAGPKERKRLEVRRFFRPCN